MKVIVLPNNLSNIGSVGINKQTNIKAASLYLSNPASFNLQALGDVVVTNPQDGDTLVYDASINKYVVETLPKIDGGTF